MSTRGDMTYSRETGWNMGMEYCDTCIFRVKGKRRGRRKLGKPTSEAQEKINEQNARMKFVRLLHANFSEGEDLKLDLTFDEAHAPETREKAKHLTDNFLRRVKRHWVGYLETDGKPFKYLYVIEGGDGKRIHVHMVMSGGISRVQLRALWGMAAVVNVDTLQGSSTGFEGLGKYLTKQGRLAGEHRWYGSRNLCEPTYEEHNNGIKASEVEELARAIEDINAKIGEGVQSTAERYAPVEERYPGYYLAEASATYIETFREWVLHIKLYRKDTVAGVDETRRRRAEERELKRQRAAYI